MPSYIELDKNLTLPASSNVGNVTFGITTANEAVLVDSTGHVIPIGGGGPGINYNSYTANLSEVTPDYYYNGTLVVGQIYTITDYYLGDDFSNVADIQQGNINSNGCVFIATGTTPTSWQNSTELLSAGNPTVNATLDNTLGFTPDWNYLTQGTYSFNFSQCVDYNKIVPNISPTAVNALGSTVEINYQGVTMLDTTFNVGDGFNNALGGFNNYVYAVAEQEDGKLIVGGNFNQYGGTYSCYYIARLNPDGSFDRGFDIGSGFNDFVRSIKIQPDGKILVGGYFNRYKGNPVSNGLVRLNTDGTLDNTFNSGGNGFNGVIFTLDLQSDNKIIAGGSFGQYNDMNSTYSSQYIARLNTDGTYDITFSNYYGFNGEVYSVKVQPDDKILAGGAFTNYTDHTNTYSQYKIARLNSNGSYDTGFNAGGTGFSIGVNTIDLQSDGKIIVGGEFHQYNDAYGTYSSYYIARLDTAGQYDTTFSVYGNSGFNSSVATVAVQPMDYIIAGGFFTSYNGVGLGYIVQLDPNGNFYGFNRTFSNPVQALALQQDGKVVAGGRFDKYDSGTYSANYITRLHGNSEIDQVLPFGYGFSSQVFTTAAQADGKVIVGGGITQYNQSTSYSSYYITRLDTNGLQDTTFQTMGGFNDYVVSSAVQSDGKILVGGPFTYYSGSSIAPGIVRINNSGSLDTTFATNVGTGYRDAFNNPLSVTAIAIQPDGKILGGGDANSSTFDGNPANGIFRLNADGTYDNTFTVGTGITNGGSVRSIAVQPDGKIVVGGLFTSYDGTSSAYNILRLDNSGSLDATFTTNSGYGFNDRVFSLGLQSNGQIIAGGRFTNYNDISGSYSGYYIARLNADGTYDPNFASYNAGFDRGVNTLAIQSDDSILAGGDFRYYNGTNSGYIARLDSNGSLLNSMSNYGGGFDRSVDTITPLEGNKLIAGGRFSKFDGTNSGYYIARLYAGYDVTLVTRQDGGGHPSAPQDNLLNKTPIDIRLYN